MDTTENTKSNDPTSSMFDGSLLPQMIMGLDDYKPDTVQERSTFYAKDTKNKYMFISGSWVLIEKLS